MTLFCQSENIIAI